MREETFEVDETGITVSELNTRGEGAPRLDAAVFEEELDSAISR